MVMPFIRRKRLWSKGKEGVYVVSPNVNDLSLGKKESKTRKRSYDSDRKASISSARGSIASLDTNDDSKQHNHSRKSSLGNGYGSLDSLEDEQVWDSISMEEKAVRLLSTHRRQSVDPKQIQVEVHQYDTVAKPGGCVEEEAPHVDPMDEETLAHVQNVVASILERYKEDSSDSDSSTSVSKNSELDFHVSSEEESEPDDEKGEVFDFNAHIKKICKRDDGSESESDGNDSVTSEKAYKTAVRKAMKKITRERSDELAASDNSVKGSENERSPTSDDNSSSSDQDDDESDSSSGENEKESFEMARDVDPEIQELMADGLVIDPKKGKSGAGESRTVYRYYMNNEGKIDSVSETADNLSEEDEGPSTVNTQENTLASTLEDSKAQELRWPFSSFYVKEINQEATFSENWDALPSYRSTQASASHPGRKRNVMLGRIWWVEWWAREDTKTKSSTMNASTTSL